MKPRYQPTPGTSNPGNQSNMKTFKITVPPFSIEFRAKNRKEALEQYWFCYDDAEKDPKWGKPAIQEIPTKSDE